MNLFIKNILKFTIILTVAYIGYIIAWGLFAPDFLKTNLNYRIGSYGNLNSRVKEISSYGDVDMLVLGSSHAYRGFDPRIFKENNIKMFNLGSSSQTPMQTEILVERYLDKLNPEVVLFEVYPNAFQVDGVESTLDLIANDKIDLKLIINSLKLNNFKIYNTLIYGIFRQLFSLDDDFIEPVKKHGEKDTYIKGGFVEKEVSIFNDTVQHISKSWDFRNDQIEAFERILLRLKRKGIKVIIVQTPITEDLYNEYYNNDEIDSFFSSFNVPYFNFNLLVNLPNEYFYDSNHLNQNGVILFNNELIKIIKKQNF